MAEITLLEAVNLAFYIFIIMQHDDNVVVLGEDIEKTAVFFRQQLV